MWVKSNVALISKAIVSILRLAVALSNRKHFWINSIISGANDTFNGFVIDGGQ